MNMKIPMEANPLNSYHSCLSSRSQVGLHCCLFLSHRHCHRPERKHQVSRQAWIRVSILYLSSWGKCWFGLFRSMADKSREQGQQAGLPTSRVLVPLVSLFRSSVDIVQGACTYNTSGLCQIYWIRVQGSLSPQSLANSLHSGDWAVLTALASRKNHFIRSKYKATNQLKLLLV